MNRHHIQQDASGSSSSPRKKKRNRRQRQQQHPMSAACGPTSTHHSSKKERPTRLQRTPKTASWMEDDIEEQLRLQRLKRQPPEQQQLQQTQINKDCIQTISVSQQPLPRMGNFVYDPERDAYFPESFLIAQQQQKQQSDLCNTDQDQSSLVGGQRSPVAGASSSAWLSYARELNSGANRGGGGERYRRNLTCQWRAQHWLEQLQILAAPNVVQSSLRRRPSHYDTNDNLLLADQQLSSWPCPNNITPWNRTFDVATTNFPPTNATAAATTAYPPILYRIEGTHLCARNVDGSVLDTNSTHVVPATHVKVLEHHHRANRSSVVVALHQSEECCTVSVTGNVAAADGRAGSNYYNYTVQLPPGRIHDCTRTGASTTTLWFGGVANTKKSSRNNKGRYHQLWWTDGENTARHGSYGVFSCGHGLPASDILCMENLDHVTTSGSSVVFGHRNGQVSLQDLRARNATSCSVVSEGSASVVALYPLNEHRPYEILVRRNTRHRHERGGTCQLLDARRFASTPPDSSTTTLSRSLSVIHELRLPQQQSTSSGSNCCKGVATDPYQTIAMAPYVDPSSHAARLAVWSLDTGVMVGSRPIPFDTTNMPCLDLCSKITSTLETTTVPDDNILEGEPTSEMVLGSYSLWLNCGSHGICQIVSPGSPVG